MSRRNRKHDTSQRAGETSSPQEVERLILKDRLKDAFKQAKLCFRQQGSPENRRLLERTYLLRIKELAHGGMSSAAAEVARHFLEFGVTDSNLLEDLVVVLPRVGLSDQAVLLSGRLKSPEAQASLSIKLVDRAVGHPDQIPPSRPELREGAERIRGALAALDAENEAAAMELLKDIPRSSPWADWRYFARGLAAYRRGESEQAVANWDRLDPARSAHRIASALRRAAPPPGSAATDGQRAENPDLSNLEVMVFGESILGRLDRLRRAIDRTDSKHFDWKQALQTLGSLRQSLRKSDPKLAQRLTEILLDPLRIETHQLPQDASERLVRDFTKAAEPLPLDPRWNRLWAILWEQLGDGKFGAIERWKEYLVDVERHIPLEPVEQRRLQALVWRHIAQLYDDEADNPNGYRFSEDSDEDLRNRAVDALEQSLRLDSQQRATYEMLIELHEDEERPEEVAAAVRKLLAAFPDDLNALRRLIEHHQRRDEPEPVIQLAQQARRLKPLAVEFAQNEWWGRVAQARHLALAKCWDDARAELALADALQPEAAGKFSTLARRAALEFKAGQTDAAYDYVRRAEATLTDPAPLCFELAIQAARYKLSATLKRGFEQQLKVALGKRKNGTTAALMAEVMLALQAEQADYPERKKHLKQATEYLQKTTKAKFTEAELAQVCLFLHQIGEGKQLETLTRRGLKAYPKRAVFPWLDGMQMLAKGPYSFAFNVRRIKLLFERAKKLAEASSDPLDTGLLPDIKRQLALVSNMSDAMPGLPGRGAFGGRGPSPLDFLDFLGMGDEDDDEFDDDDDYDDESDFFFGRPFLGRRRSKGQRK